MNEEITTYFREILKSENFWINLAVQVWTCLNPQFKNEPVHHIFSQKLQVNLNNKWAVHHIFSRKTQMNLNNNYHPHHAPLAECREEGLYFMSSHLWFKMVWKYYAYSLETIQNLNFRFSIHIFYYIKNHRNPFLKLCQISSAPWISLIRDM